MTTKAEYEQGMAERQRQYDEIKAKFPDLVTKGFSCNPGWFPLIRGFFAVVAETLEDHPEREFVLLQVKEKFGGLHIYYRLIPFGNDDVASRIHAAQQAAEKKSWTTCDVCGQPGVLRKQGNWWFLTRCDEHAEGGIPVPGGGNDYTSD